MFILCAELDCVCFCVNNKRIELLIELKRVSTSCMHAVYCKIVCAVLFIRLIVFMCHLMRRLVAIIRDTHILPLNSCFYTIPLTLFSTNETQKNTLTFYCCCCCCCCCGWLASIFVIFDLINLMAITYAASTVLLTLALISNK